MSGRIKNVNIVIFLDTINVKLMVLLVKLYLFILLSVIWTIFQGHRDDKKFSLKILCSYLIKIHFVGLLYIQLDHGCIYIYDYF